jgi:hypothetical protein
MKGVAKDELVTKLLDVFKHHRLDGTLRPNWHEDWRLQRCTRKRQHSKAGTTI